MKNLTAAFIVALFTLVLGSPTLLHAQAKEPFEFYKKYLEVLAKADSLTALLPYYTQELGSGLGKMPAEMQANYVKMNRRSLTDLKLNKQQVESNKTYLEMTAKAADGQETSGRATLVQEGGAWKIEDEAWIANLPRSQ